jgi:Tol biopolymer transport system component
VSDHPVRDRSRKITLSCFGILLVGLVALAILLKIILARLGPSPGWVSLWCGRDYAEDTGSWEIITVDGDAHDVASADQHNLTNSPLWEDEPAWSPDSTQIAFLVRDDNDIDLYLMNTDGTGRHNLTQSTVEEWHPAWSPDGKWIAYESHPTLNDSQIAIIRPDGSDKVIFPNEEGRSLDANWSPDASMIAFVHFEEHNESDLYLLTLPDEPGTRPSNPTRLTTMTGRVSAPRWSPDGSRIAFLFTANGGSTELYLINRDGTGLTHIPYSSDIDTVEWSPDGTQLLVSALTNILVVDIESLKFTQIGTGNLPVWSPDGSRVAFTDGQVAVMKADGSDVRHLTSEPRYYRTELVWSPDGTRLAFSRLHYVCNMP